MKHTIHTPTGDFAYIATEFDHDDFLASQDILMEHQTLVNSVKGGEGLDNKTFIGILDELWVKHSVSGDPGIIEQMSPSQKEIVRAFKLVIQRNK